jgi:hypothetical protein
VKLQVDVAQPTINVAQPMINVRRRMNETARHEAAAA